MGDTNTINMGAGAQAKQIAAGSNITQIYIESARQYDARFSIPAPPNNFTGRANEIDALVKQLTSGKESGAVIAAITGVAGMGGIGKSALAAVVATLVAPHFPDAQMWLDLRGASPEPLHPTDAMRQIILAFEPLADLRNADEDQLAQLYRSALHEKRALLVLDNARDNAQVRPLLSASCAFLITARATLTEGGLNALRLDVMEEKDARDYLISLCARLKPTTDPSTSSGQAGRRTTIGDELCETCGYLPLAIKIVGSYLAARPNISPALYLAQLKQRRLELLRERDDPELNVEASFSLTYDQLTPTLQVLWRVLSIFPAPFWGRAAQFVWGLDDEMQAASALGDLLQASLIEYDAETEKYRWHDLLREFASGRMTNDERQTAAKRHAEFYEQVARQADKLYLQGGENVVKGLNLFEQELTHIRVGQAWAASNANENEDAAKLCNDYPLPYAGSAVMQLRLSAREQIRWLEQAANAAKKIGAKASEGAHLGNLGLAYADLGEVRRAIAYYEQALVVMREIGDKRAEGSILGNLGLAYADLGEVRRAIAFYEQALVVMREIGDRRGEGNVLGNLGSAYAALGEVRQAIAYHEQALVIAREIGDRRGEGNALANMGLAHEKLGDMKRAGELWRAALAIYEQIESPMAERVRGWLGE